jgi:adenylate cyclase
MQAIDAARAVIRVAAKSDDHLPVGAGVHTGVAFVGTVGEGSHVEFTAMGDPVNITARLASAAGAGEVLVTLASAASAGFDTTGRDRRTLELKGKSEAIEVVVVDDGRPTIKA